MFKLPKKNNNKGFTLIELIVVIGILAIILSITLVAVNPLRQFRQANNTQRRNDVAAILSAISQYAADNDGQLPSGITTTATEVGDGTGEVDLCSALVPTYLAEMPIDPTAGTGSSGSDCAGTYSTGYTVASITTSNRVTVAAPSAELSETITVTR